MNTFEELKTLQLEIYEGNKANGFWNEGKDRNQGEAVMLIITELSEAVEGDRKGRVFNSSNIAASLMMPDAPTFKANFETTVKDTTADEMADAVIRLLDTTYGFEWPLIEREYRKEATGNFAHDCLKLTWYSILAFHNPLNNDTEHPGKDWGYVLAAIIKFCEWYNIDIYQHTVWKLKYNKTRGYKHGNKAY